MPLTPIEWVLNAAGEQGHTINPIRFRNLATGKVGHHCEKISPGCKFCYASTMNGGPYLSGLTYLAENTPKGEYFLDEGALDQVVRRRKPTAYFWCDMTDMFGAWVPDEWIDRCVAVMACTRQHRHFVLTKRADRMREYFSRFVPSPAWDDFITRDGIDSAHSPRGWPIFSPERWPLPDVWLGVSVEDQQRADERIPLLLQTSAAMRFISAEPLLERVDLKRYLIDDFTGDLMNGPCERHRGLDWVIVGGESGPSARPCEVAGMRDIVRQCAVALVPCFVKQLGAKPVADDWELEAPDGTFRPRARKGGDPSEWAADLRVRQMPGRRDEQ